MSLIHPHLVVTAYATNPPLSVESGETFLHELVDLVGMQILMDAEAIYCEDLGNEGVTGVVGLTTSHSSFHSWHAAERPFINFDLYSCREFDVGAVLAHLNHHFDCVEADYTLFDRAPGAKNKILAEGTAYFNAAVGTTDVAEDAITAEEWVAQQANQSV